jgi:hypothetical protein
MYFLSVHEMRILASSMNTSEHKAARNVPVKKSVALLVAYGEVAAVEREVHALRYAHAGTERCRGRRVVVVKREVAEHAHRAHMNLHSKRSVFKYVLAK